MRCTMPTTTTTAANSRPQPSVPNLITILSLLLLLLACCGISHIQSLEESQNATSPPPPSPASALQQTTITTPNPKDSNTPSPTTTTATTTGQPNINKIESSNTGEQTKKLTSQQEATSSINSINMSNKQQAIASDFAPDSIEAKVADATTRFGLNFIKSLGNDKDNVVISPLSLQNLLNMILLGSDNQSATEQELIKVLGYETTELISRSQQSSSSSSSSLDNSLRPHESMRNVLNSIMKATQSNSSPSSSQSQMSELLNTNSVVLPNNSTTEQSGTLTAHLETSVDQPPSASTGVSSGSPVNFTLANLILTDDSVSLSDCYSKYLKTYYNVKVEQFSKKKNNKESNSTTSEQLPLHERVNQWVKNMTQNQIENLVQQSDLEGPLLMILLNAAHFKGRWLYTFNQKMTREQPFFNNGDDKSISDVPFMRQKGNFGYADFGQFSAGSGYGSSDARNVKTSASEDAETLLTVDVDGANNASSTKMDYANQEAESQLPVIELSKEESKRLELTSKLNCSVLMLPFALNDGQELSLVILLPTKRNGLDELMGALSYQNLNEIYKSLSDQQVQVELPKFSFESSHDAKDILVRLGLKQMFNEAHLERMFKATTSTPKETKNVGKVIHKAKIAVDESGAEAAAASLATVFLRNFIRPPTPTFVANHPFLFIIRHNRSNMPLFMGQVNKF